MKTRNYKTTICTLLVFIFTNIYATSNSIHVSGIVSDQSTNTPIKGVMVRIPGAKYGTKTDKNGVYSVNVEKGKRLEFTHSEYIKKVVRVKLPTLNIKLQKKQVIKNEIAVLEETRTAKENKLTAPDMEVRSGVAPMLLGGYTSNNYKRTKTYYPSSPVQQNTEEYHKYKENRFKDVKENPLSTFSLDVDAASYSNMRRMINNGQLPNKNSIRVEEMLNYFSYKYEQPNGKDPVKINTEIHACPWNKNHLLARIGVKAKEIPSDNLPASNFVFLLDVSGSMSSPNKLPLVKSSLKLLTNNMRSKDRIAIVVYAGAAGIVLESTPGDDKQKIVEAFEKLQAGGSTAGGAGIELAYKIAQKNFVKKGNNRIILCTDGDFNVGVSSEKGLEELIEEKRKSGIFLTVLGFGMGNYKENRLQALAEKGNGNHAYIDNIQEANKVLVNEFGSTMYAVAKDVKLQVEFNPTVVSSYRLVGYESRLLNKEDFNDDTKDAGELGAGHTVTALYEIIPVGVENRYGGVDPLRYEKGIREVRLKRADFTEELMFVKLRYKPITSDRSIKMEIPVKYSDNERKSDDYNFAVSVAMFAQLLKDSDFKGNATYKDVIALAEEGVGQDKKGYRREFIRLVESINQMVK